jgi:hypothetical protein
VEQEVKRYEVENGEWMMASERWGIMRKLDKWVARINLLLNFVKQRKVELKPQHHEKNQLTIIFALRDCNNS